MKRKALVLPLIKFLAERSGTKKISSENIFAVIIKSIFTY